MTFGVVLVGWVLSLCLHEYAHARVAFVGGDRSVAEKGYLSFNPLRYAHPTYSILMPLVVLMMGGIGLPGGAVYIDESALRSRGWRSAVAAAGPAANVVTGLTLVLGLRMLPDSLEVLRPALAFLVLIEVTSTIFNLLPVSPMDGFGVLAPWLPVRLVERMHGLGVAPVWILFFALAYPPVGRVFWDGVYTTLQALGVSPGLARRGLHEFMFWRAG
ncbi:MAG: site-2 protease family protein [Deltaproteobacteria bacterium]|nr:site-2 protease family protein [Deltaproteobacteria bacterium]